MDARPDAFFPILPFLIIGLIVLLGVGIAFKRQAARFQALRSVADRWQGQAFQGGFFQYPHAELRIGGTIARLQFSDKGKRGAYTDLTIHFPNPALRLEIYPQTIVDQMRKLLGMQDIEVGVPAFDDRFVIQGNNQDEIREYLTLPTQAALQQLAQSTHHFNLHLTLGGGTLRVTKSTDLYKEMELRRFVESFEALFLALVDARSLGIEFLPKSAPARILHSHCQVCGEALQGSVVFCTSCDTPHHLECWQYFGSCSVYACGQKRYRAAKVNVPGEIASG